MKLIISLVKYTADPSMACAPNTPLHSLKDCLTLMKKWLPVKTDMSVLINNYGFHQEDSDLNEQDELLLNTKSLPV